MSLLEQVARSRRVVLNPHPGSFPSDCPGCGVPTVPTTMPTDQRPVGSRNRAARGMCWRCYAALRRHNKGTKPIDLTRVTPCGRCGTTAGDPGHLATVLCRDCTDVTAVLQELELWESAS